MSLSRQLAGLASGRITTVAGVGYLDGVPAREAPAGTPQGVVRTAAGDLIVLDMWGHRIWRIDTAAHLRPLEQQAAPSVLVGIASYPSSSG